MAFDPFLASIQTVGFNFAPTGWALCNGQIIPIAQNTALFALIGTTYGGNGITNFALPNLQGRRAIHQGQGLGLSSIFLGQTGGVEIIQLTAATMPAHTHAVTVGVSTQEGEEASPTNKVIASVDNGFSTSPANGSLGGVNVAPVGLGQPFQIVNPYLAINFCIAIQGIFPSRA